MAMIRSWAPRLLMLMMMIQFNKSFGNPAGGDVMTFRAEEEDRCNKSVDIYQSVSSPPVTSQNRHQPLHCTYKIRVRPARNDWVVYVRFTRMRVGEPNEDRTACLGGYVQIVDGYKETNHSNKDSPGFYCGEIDSPKTFMSETPHVKIILHVDSYDNDYFLQFDANVEQQQEMHARYGQYAQLYPHRRGTLVPGMYCERIYNNCAPTRCFLQSPGYPGIYPRNLNCKYHLKVTNSVAVLDWNAFDVDGLRCDNMLLCFPRTITKTQEECPYDYVKVYDGPTTDSPLIITLCGRGRLKSQIVASASDLLLEFVSSPAGPLLNTGFHFKAESGDGDAEVEHEALHLNNGSCTIEKTLHDTQHGTFRNLRSWYPANTTCSYKFLSSEDEILRLTFDFFRMERVTFCDESLKLYDASYADPSRIMVKLCDINKPKTDQPKAVYESSGPALFVEFMSKIGSLEGSSLNYAFEIRSVNVAAQRNHMSQNSCSRSYTPGSGLSGEVSATVQEVNSSSTNQAIVCNYTFDASVLPQGRVNTTLFSPLRRAEDCNECRREPLYIEAILGAGPRHCFCKVGNLKRHNFFSLGPRLYLTLYVDHVWDKRLPQKQIFNVSYNFFSESRCGTERLELGLQGLLTFPPLGYNFLPTCSGGYCWDGLPLFCTWKIPVFHRMDVAFRVNGLATKANCSADHIIIGRVFLCPSPIEQEVVLHKDEIDADVTVNLRLSSDYQLLNVTVRWTQLRMLPTQSRSENLVSLGKDCDFLCANSLACLTRDLVCNGVYNCPGQSTTPTADEEYKLCYVPMDTFIYFWWAIGFGLAAVVLLFTCVTFAMLRRCHRRRHRF